MESIEGFVRCVDTKTGKEKYMPEKLTKDRQLMSTYNLKVQDLDVKKKELEESSNGEELEEKKEVVSISKTTKGGKKVNKNDDGIDE